MDDIRKSSSQTTNRLPKREQSRSNLPPARPKPLREGAPSVLFSTKRDFGRSTAHPLQPQKPAASPKKVEISVSLPPLSSPFRLLKKLLKIPLKVWVIIGIIGIVIYLGYHYLYEPSIISSNSPTVTTTDLPSKPDYATILPGGKTIGDLGGWKRVSPPGKNPVFAYADTVGGMQIAVSEQPLPQEFKNDTAGKISKLAEGYAANEKVKVGDTTVYIGTSAQGPQSAILTKNDLLILIKSTAKLTSDQWAQYVNSLK